ncbi:MAG: hypothetical protein WCH46_08765 [bacterium]
MIQNGSKRFLKYEDSSADLFRSKPFVATGHDTLSYARDVGFDDKFYMHGMLVDTSDSDSLKWMQDSANAHYNNKEITPNNSSFGMSSTVKFVLEICKTSTKAVVLRLDTSLCFRNNLGYLRFQNFPMSFNIVENVSLSSLTPDTSYYINIRRLDNLPSGSSFVGFVFSDFPHNSGVTDFYYITQHQVGYPQPSQKYNSQGHIGNPSNIRITSTDPNTSSGKLTISLLSTEDCALKSRVFNNLGAIVHEQDITLVNGLNSIPVDISLLPSGRYEFMLTSASQRLTSSFNIVK